MPGWLDPCVAVQRSAYSQVQMQYRTYMARSEMPTGRWALLYCAVRPARPASNVETGAANAQQELVCTPSPWHALHDLLVVRLGYDPTT